MKTYVSKKQEIKVIGQWTGGEDEVTQWLTDNGYTWKIQVESDKGHARRLEDMAEWSDEEKAEHGGLRKRLTVLGDDIYVQWSCDIGGYAVLRKGVKDHGEDEAKMVLTFYDADRINDGFDEAA